MNTQPVYYMQTDSRWADTDYSASGESTTIGKAGCGPTCMAMVVATWADSSVTPATEAAWALANGYKAKNQGTYYSYFVPAAARYGLTCTRVNYSSIYGNSSSAYHTTVKNAVDNGDLVIACMGKGTWTSSGHFVLVWKIDGNVVYINDPNSTATSRTQGNYTTFKSQVKYYFIIEKPVTATTTTTTEEDEDMTLDTFTDLFKQYRATLQDNDASSYSEEARTWAVNNGIIQGSSDGEFNGMWQDYLDREQMVTILYRFAQLIGKA